MANKNDIQEKEDEFDEFYTEVYLKVIFVIVYYKLISLVFR